MTHLKTQDLRAFFTILETNPRLEELMLSKITPDNRAPFVHECHSPIHMPKLKRLFVEQIIRHVVDPILSVVHQTLSLPPTCTRYYNLAELDPRPAAIAAGYIYICAFQVERLVVSSTCLIGTDGTSACVITCDPAPEHFMRCIQNTKVTELWLHTSLSQTVYNPFGGYPEGVVRSAIKRMNKVTKLVIMCDISDWLRDIDDAFPDLKELHIHTYFMAYNDREAILRYLTKRNWIRPLLNTLCFVGDSISHGSKAFNSWKAQPSDFESLANEVIFEDVHPPSDSEESCFNHFVSTRLGLPDVCKHTSQIHTVWKPWDTYVKPFDWDGHQPDDIW